MKNHREIIKALERLAFCPHGMSRITLACLIALGIALLSLPRFAMAMPIEWMFSDITFDDGGIVTGSLMFDADLASGGILLSGAISISGGDEYNFPPVTFSLTNDNWFVPIIDSVYPYISAAIDVSCLSDPSGLCSESIYITLDGAPTANKTKIKVNSIKITGLRKSTDLALKRGYTYSDSVYIEAQSVPEPASLLLVAAGLVCFILQRRRRMRGNALALR